MSDQCHDAYLKLGEDYDISVLDAQNLNDDTIFADAYCRGKHKRNASKRR